MLHTYSKVFKTDVVLLIVRLAVLAAVTLTVPVVLFPVSGEVRNKSQDCGPSLSEWGCSPVLFFFPFVCRFAPPSISSCVRPRTSAGFVTASSPWPCWAGPTPWSFSSPPSGTSLASSVSLSAGHPNCAFPLLHFTPVLPKTLPSRRGLCCRHAHLHPAVGFLHQTGEEGVHEVCAEDRGKIFPSMRNKHRTYRHHQRRMLACDDKTFLPSRLPPSCSAASWS